MQNTNIGYAFPCNRCITPRRETSLRRPTVQLHNMALRKHSYLRICLSGGI